MKNIDQRLNALIINYGAFIRGVNSAVQAHVGGSEALSSTNAASLRLSIDQIMLDNYAVFDSKMTADVQGLAQNALDASRETSAVVMRINEADALQRLQDELQRLSRVQYDSLLNNDKQAILGVYNATNWRFSKMLAAGVKREDAMAAAKKTLAKHTGQFIDRAGRQWQGDRYIQVAIGHNLYRAWNETTIYSAILQKRPSVFINGDDGSKEEISLEDIDAAMIILDERLHIGSSRWLTVD